MLYKFDGKQPSVGNGTYISPSAEVIGNVTIGADCYIGHGVIVRGDYGRIEIGDGVALEEGVIVHAPPDDTGYIGQEVTVGHGAIIHGKRIGDMAVIGMGAVISIWSEIGKWSIVAEGSVVRMKKVIPPDTVAAGNPARIVRKVKPRDREFWLYGKQLYKKLAKKYLNEKMERVDNY